MPLAFILVMAITVFTAWETLRVNEVAQEVTHEVEADTIAFNMLSYRHHLQLALTEHLAPATYGGPMTEGEVAAIKSFLAYSGDVNTILGGLTPSGQNWFKLIDGVKALFHEGEVIVYYDPPHAGYQAVGLQKALLEMTQGSFSVGRSVNGGPTGREMLSLKLNSSGGNAQVPIQLRTPLPGAIPVDRVVLMGGSVNPLETRSGSCYENDVFSYVKHGVTGTNPNSYTDIRYRYDFIFNPADQRPTLQTTQWQRDTGVSTSICPLLP